MASVSYSTVLGMTHVADVHLADRRICHTHHYPTSFRPGFDTLVRNRFSGGGRETEKVTRWETVL